MVSVSQTSPGGSVENARGKKCIGFVQQNLLGHLYPYGKGGRGQEGDMSRAKASHL